MPENHGALDSVPDQPLGPPQIVDDYTLMTYNAAVRAITGVVSPEISRATNPYPVHVSAQFFINRTWPLYFTHEQQEAILEEYGLRLLRMMDRP